MTKLSSQLLSRLFCLLCLTTPVSAADPEPAFVDQSATGANDGTSWTDAFIDLQSALNADSTCDEIWVAQGTYKPTSGSDRTATFQLTNDLAIYGGFSGTETALSERNSSVYITTLSGDIGTVGDSSDNTYHVLTASGSNSAPILDGCTITKGNANASGINGCGGGLQIRGGSPTITNCSFVGNSAFLCGAISSEFSSSSPLLTNCSFQGNSAYYGGAIGNIFAASPVLINCSFVGNSAFEDGGAIYNSDATSPNLTNCSFVGNSASNHGGAIYNFFTSPLLINCSFQGNSSTNDGGAIYNESSPTSLTNCIVWNNAANGSTASTSASVFNDFFSTPTYSHSLIANIDLSSSGTNNFNGTSSTNAPLFALAVNPHDAPTTGGDLRLLPNSPAIDAGRNSDNNTSTDIRAATRIQNVSIDLGAYEFTPALDDPYIVWVNSVYPGETNSNIIGMTADPNNDGWPNALAFTLAMNPNIYDANMLPTFSVDSNYMIIEYARSDRSAYLNPYVRYGTDMINWTVATHGENSVIIEVLDDGLGHDFQGVGIDKVTVKIPVSGQKNLFLELVVDSQ